MQSVKILEHVSFAIIYNFKIIERHVALYLKIDNVTFKASQREHSDHDCTISLRWLECLVAQKSNYTLRAS